MQLAPSLERAEIRPIFELVISRVVPESYRSALSDTVELTAAATLPEIASCAALAMCRTARLVVTAWWMASSTIGVDAIRSLSAACWVLALRVAMELSTLRVMALRRLTMLIDARRVLNAFSMM
jgi:hypothetical protein